MNGYKLEPWGKIIKIFDVIYNFLIYPLLTLFYFIWIFYFYSVFNVEINFISLIGASLVYFIPIGFFGYFIGIKILKKE